jgi:hypothetical protein
LHALEMHAKPLATLSRAPVHNAERTGKSV